MFAHRTAGFVLLAGLLLPTGCGGAEERAPFEDDDATSGGQAQPSRIATMPTGVDGTSWRFVEARCTEGPLDLAPRGYGSVLRIEGDESQLLLTYDSTFTAEGCVQTIVQRVTPPAEPGELQMEETARVAVPSTSACFGQPEPPRPGEVNRVGELLEVRVQRSRWCGGFEVTMTYAPARPSLLENDEVVRHYFADYTRGDAGRLSRLFAETGTLSEPFTVTPSGDPFRHEGRGNVETWFSEAFANTEWRAMRVTAVEPGATPQEVTARWEYMDSRLAEPLAGANVFTIAAGEIFESEIRLSGTPVLTGSAAAEAAARAAEATPAAATPTTETPATAPEAPALRRGRGARGATPAGDRPARGRRATPAPTAPTP